MLSRRDFIRNFVVLAFAVLLEMFGFKRPEDQASNMYKFNLGKSALRIGPNESFSATIHWPVAPSVKGNNPMKIIVDPRGFMYQSI